MTATLPLPVSRVDALRRGAFDVAPIVAGVVPFGVVAGAAAVDAGYSWVEALGFSSLVFAGASQLAAIDLAGRGAPVVVAVATVLVINARMLMYGASLAPHLVAVPARRRAAAAYLLTDQAFALSTARYQDGLPASRRLAYFVGVALPLWLNWQLTTLLGAVVGASVPDGVPIEFAIPLTFLVLLVPSVTDRPTLVAALTGAVVAVVGAPLPANLGMLLGAVSGIVAGVVAHGRPEAVPT